MSDEYRWNALENEWQFNEPAWGGWMTLRRGAHVSSPPMTFAQGFEYIVLFPLVRGRERETQWVRDRMGEIEIGHIPPRALKSRRTIKQGSRSPTGDTEK